MVASSMFRESMTDTALTFKVKRNKEKVFIYDQRQLMSTTSSVNKHNNDGSRNTRIELIELRNQQSQCFAGELTT